MKHRLARPPAHVDGDKVVRQPFPCCDVGHELEHPLGLVRRKLADLTERIDVPLGEDEEVDGRLGVDVADGDEAVGRGDVIAFAVELAEETVVAHPARIPSSETAAARTPSNSPTGADSG